MVRVSLLRASAIAAALVLTAPALAQDSEDDEDDAEDLLEDEDFDDLFGEDEIDDEDPDRIEGPDALEDTDESALDSIEGVDPAEFDDLLGEPVDAPAEDDATFYREFLDRVEGLDPEEEIPAWERYLTVYPNTPFKERIEARVESLMDSLYEERIERGSDGKDAMDEEIKFSHPLLLENINPRSRVIAGFEWGLPAYLNLYAGYEHQLARNFSVHGGVRRRYTGWNVEAGTRYALIKAERTQTLLTLIGDVHFNMEPAFVGVRPQLALGKNFGDVIHAQVQFGGDFEIRRYPGVRVIGGANVTWLASKSVAIFAEGGVNLKNLTWKEGGVFGFNTATIGLKFFPASKSMDAGQMELNLGASAPVSTYYYQYHYGSVMGQFNYYLK